MVGVMAHIDQVEEILETITSYTLTQGEIQATATGIWLSPSPVIGSLSLEEVEYFDIVIIEATLALLEAKKTAFLKVKSNLLFAPATWNNCGSIAVVDGTVFAVDDALEGGTSSATGIVYKIVSNTLYLKTVTGVWQSGETITDGGTHTSTTTSTLTDTIFPFFMDSFLTQYRYDVLYNVSVGGLFAATFRIEARWAL